MQPQQHRHEAPPPPSPLAAPRSRRAPNNEPSFAPPQPIGPRLPRSRRVAASLERSGLGAAINVASALLSVFSVGIYVWEIKAATDDPLLYARLRLLDLATAVVFLAEWALWLWLSPSKRRYLLSFQSWVDLLTAIPMIVSFALGASGMAAGAGGMTGGAAAAESLFRAARVLRVYRLFRLGRRVRDEATSRVCELALTVAVLVFILAVLFFDLETNYSESYPDLTFGDSVYFAAITLTTVGYGDYVPTIWQSRLMLVIMLIVMFTVLPLQTSAVVSAIAARSPFQRASYRPAGDGAHVIVAAPSGLTGEAAERLAGTLLSPSRLDQGSLLRSPSSSSSSSSSRGGSAAAATPLLSACAYGRVVFLCPHPPDARTRALLKSSAHAGRVRYLQGSCLRPGDLARAAVGSAAAVLLLADERSDDPQAHDLMQGASLMTLGHALKARDRAEAREAAHYARRYAGLAAVVVAGASGPTSGGARALFAGGLGLSRRLALALAAQLLRLTLAAVRLRDWLLLRPEPTYVAAARRAQRAALHAARAARVGEKRGTKRSDGGGNGGGGSGNGGANGSQFSSPAAAAAAGVMAAAAAAALRPPKPPRVLVQLLLPESRAYVQQMLHEMRGGGDGAAPPRPTPSSAGGKGGIATPAGPTSPGGGGGDGGGVASPAFGSFASGHLPRAESSGDGGAGSLRPGGLERLVELASAAMLRHARGGGGGGGASARVAPQPAAAAAVGTSGCPRAGDDADPERPPPPAPCSARAMLRLRPVPSFWRRFGASVSVVCAAELRAAMLAISASPAHCPGAAALLSNLVRPVAGGGGALPDDLLFGSGAGAPPPLSSSSPSSSSFADRYLRSAALSGLHGVRRLPRHLAGQPFSRVALYAHASFGAALVALVERRRRWRWRGGDGGQGSRGGGGGGEAEEGQDEEEDDDDDDDQASDKESDCDFHDDDDDEDDDDDSDDDEDEEEEEPALVLAPPPPGKRIRRRSGALVIAPDARAAAALAAAPRAHYDQWRRAQQQRACAGGGGKIIPQSRPPLPGEAAEQGVGGGGGGGAPVPDPPPPPPLPPQSPPLSPPQQQPATAPPPAFPPVLACARHLSGHVLLCGGDGTRPSVLLAAVLPLRAASRGGAPAVVILDRRLGRRRSAAPDDDDPDAAAAWARLASLGGVFVVQGTAAHPGDLRRAGADAASGAVVLCRASPHYSGGLAAALAASASAAGDDSAGDGVGSGSVEARVLDDADALRRARLLRAALRPSARVCVELWLSSSCLGMGGLGSLARSVAAAALGDDATSAAEASSLLRAATTAEYMAGTVALSAGLGEAALCQGLQSGREGAAFLRRLLLPGGGGDGEEEEEEEPGEVVTLELREVDDLARTPTYGDLFAALVTATATAATLLPLALSRRASAHAPGNDWAAPRRWAERAAASALGLEEGSEEGGDARRSMRHRPRAPLLRYVQANPPAGERLQAGDRALVLVRRRRRAG